MTLFQISNILTIISSFCMGFLIWWKARDRQDALIWILLCISVGNWGIGALQVSYAKTEAVAFFWWQMIHIFAVIWTPIFYFHFVCSTFKLNRNKIIYFAYFSGFIFCILNVFANKLHLYAVTLRFNEFYWVDLTIYNNVFYYLLHFEIYFLFLAYAFYLFLKNYLITVGLRRNQLKYFLIGTGFGWIGAQGNYLLNFGFNIYPFTNFMVALYPIIIGYAIVRYRLLDIKIAITRAGTFIIVYTLILGFPFAIAIRQKAWFIELLGANWWMLPLGLMATLATVGPFLYIYVERKAEDRLLREQRRYQESLKQASVGMTRIRNLRKLLDLIAHIVTKTVRISYVAIYLHNEETDEYVLQVSRDKGRIPIPKITSDNPLVSWVMVKREPIIYEEIKRQMEDTNNETYRLLEENMRLLTASVVIPSFLEDRFIGFIVLGDKVSGQIYTPEDLNVFQVLASQAALAIENAQFYEEAKEMSDQIAQAEKMATIGTMADGLSHQINNRFYALSLIAGDTIDTIKLTDTSKCTPEVRQMIDDINHALERIQTNVIQGGQVVSGLLKYSRKGDSGFEPLELNSIIDNTLEMVQYKVKLSEIDIIRNFPADTPKIKGNMTQLIEVFFNFMDNAYDSIVERRTELKEERYRGKITFYAKPKDHGTLEIIVEDNGLGVKEEDLKKIFTPFFTTKISARKGTGLGLYVIKKIIVDGHKGRINFESRYKVGTRFIIELPLDK